MKELIRNCEFRYIDSGKSLELLYKDKSLYNIDDFNYLKDEFREIKNSSKSLLKNLIEEKELIDSGCNPPYCYHD